MAEPSTDSRPVRSVHEPGAKPHTEKRNRTVAWTLVVTIGVLAAVLALGAIKGADGQPVLSGKLIELTLIQVGAVSAIIWPILLRTSKDAANIKDNVQNSHPTVMRDDMDQKHSEVLAVVQSLHDRIETRFEGVASDVRGMRRDIGRHSDQFLEQGKQLSAISKHQHTTDRKLDELAEKDSTHELPNDH